MGYFPFKLIAITQLSLWDAGYAGASRASEPSSYDLYSRKGNAHFSRHKNGN
jgi:hypothetical protein